MSQSSDVAYLSRDEQIERWTNAFDRCHQQIRNQTNSAQQRLTTSPSSSSSSDVYCAAIWDDIMCWPETPAGRTVQQPCPNYINKFRTSEVASRECLPNGQWFVHPVFNKTWTNFSSCLSNEPHPSDELSLMQIHLPHIRILYHIGYGVSLVSLTAALLIMVYFRKLRCPRNLLHANLFLSFVLRAVVALVRDNILEQGVGLPHDFHQDEEDGTLSFISGGLHWECRLLYTVFYFSVAANYTWIFVEGFYLHTLIFVSFYTELSGIWCYVAFGWLCPLSILSTWVVVRATLENELCWNTHKTTGFLWIIKAPIALSILINFAFFLNILRILYTKLTLRRISAGGKDLIKRRLAKSILVLIPLFGVPYVLFLVLVEENLTESVAVVNLYFEMAFNSFNGLVVAILFCFANFEVQAELRKQWRRMRTGSQCIGFDGGGCLGQTKRYRSEARGSTNPFIIGHHHHPHYQRASCRRMAIANNVRPCRRPRRRLFLGQQRRRLSSSNGSSSSNRGGEGMGGQRGGHRVSLNSVCSTSRILPDEDYVVRLPSKPDGIPSIVEVLEEADKRCADRVGTPECRTTINLLPLTPK